MDHKPVLPIIFGIPGLEIEKDWADFFQRVSPFGFILFARNLKEPKQIKLSNEAIARIVQDDINVRQALVS